MVGALPEWEIRTDAERCPKDIIIDVIDELVIKQLGLRYFKIQHAEELTEALKEKFNSRNKRKDVWLIKWVMWFLEAYKFSLLSVSEMDIKS